MRRAAKKTSPTAAILDSQSVKTAEQGGISGYDAGKKIKGRKRHLLVDTLAKIMVCQLEIQTLQDLTNQAVYVRDGESHRTMFSSEDVERLEAIASEEERNKEVRNLLRPCSFGGGTIELPCEIEEGDAIPDWTATQFSEIKPPLLMVSTPDGTDVGRVAVKRQIVGSGDPMNGI